jgi:hypothetical protein
MRKERTWTHSVHVIITQAAMPLLCKEFFMKNKLFVSGMLALALALGFVFVGCDTGTGGDDPTPPTTAYLNEKAWVCTSGPMGSGITSLTMAFSGTNQWTETFNGTGSDAGTTVTGTYTLSGLTITATITGGTRSDRLSNGTSYSATFDATQATKLTTPQGHIFNRQP